MQDKTNWWLIAPFSEQTRKDIDLNYKFLGEKPMEYHKTPNPRKEISIEMQTNGIFQLCEGMKIVVSEFSFDLCGNEPQDNMDIYISNNGIMYCEQPNNYWCHFIGNVKTHPDFYLDKAYSICVVSIVKGDRKPAKCSVELGGIK